MSDIIPQYNIIMIIKVAKKSINKKRKVIYLI